MLKKRFIPIITLASMSLMMLSCESDSTFRGWEYMPDMYRGPALETYQPYDRFADSSSARLPVEGTIPRGFMAYPEFSSDAQGYDSAKSSLSMPKSIPTDSAAKMHGREIYSIFCGQCHGEKGDGMGILVQNDKYVGVPSYADRDINMGSIFHVVTYGKGVMGSHASQLTPEERWKVAQHVMKLRRELNADEEGGDKEDNEAEEGQEDGQEEEETNQG